MKISVIIPVYNAEKYLEEALDSVLNQTFTDFELILVNDGSTDGSSRIIESYAARDGRIVVFNKSNEGVARARADGVAISKGDYIQTMDNDDYMYPYALEKLYNRAIETGADMVVGRALFYDVDYDTKKMDSRVDFKVISGLDYFSLTCNHKACWATWTRLHKASIYREQNILVSSKVNRAEDVYLTPQLCYYAKTVVAIDDITMKWYIRSSSLSNSRKFSKKENEEFTVLPSLVEDFFKSKGVSDVVSNDILKLRVYFNQELISRGVMKNIYSRCRLASDAIKDDPAVANLLTSRMVKIIKTFDKCYLFAYLRLLKYKLKG